MHAYLDSSIIVAIMLGEPTTDRYRAHLQRYDRLVSSVLLEAEVLSAAKRCRLDLQAAQALIDHITLVTPDRPLTAELHELLAFGYCRGADAFHIATAKFLDPTAEELTFVTADTVQAQLASKIGFTIYT